VIAPRALYVPTAHLHRDRQVAEDACAGRFTQCGVTLELGLDPDFARDGLADDEEWRIEWAKFSFGLDLAHAYRETGEDRFLDAWASLVEAWIARVPVDHDPTDVIGRRLQHWISAWAAFAAAPGYPGLGGGLQDRLLESIDDQALYLRTNLTAERNHRTLELYALLVVALSLPQLDRDGDLLAFALCALHENLEADVLPDGVHVERSTHYHLVALRSFLAARENAGRLGLPLPPGYDERLAAACTFALHVHRPDGSIPAFSDADGGDYRDLLLLAGRLLERPDLTYTATAGAAGEPPAERCVSFPAGGYVVQRSGWGQDGTAFADERFLLLDCGPLGAGGHGHYDLLSLEVAAGGRPLIVDPGRYTYSEAGPNWRRWFKGTAAHSTVCVDRLDQQPYRRGKPRAPLARARLCSHVAVPGLDVVRAEAHSPAYEAVHERTVVFVAGAYWIVVDRLRGEVPHRYALRFQLAAEAQGRTVVEGCVVRAPGLALVLDEDHPPELAEGWVSPLYGVKHRAPAVVAVHEGEPDATFVTLVHPVDDRTSTPLLRLSAHMLTVTHRGVRDVIRLGERPSLQRERAA
jgi:hypothetical protein